MAKWVAKKDDVCVAGAVQRPSERPIGGGSFTGGLAAAAGLPPGSSVPGIKDPAAMAAPPASAVTKSRLEVRRQAGEVRRQIRLAAQEARGDARFARKPVGDAPGEDVGPLAALVGQLGGVPGPGSTPMQAMSPSVEALLKSVRNAEMEAALGNPGRQGRKVEKDKDKEWDDGKYWGDWSGSDWKQEEDWRSNEWNWDGSNWMDEVSEWDEYITVKDSTVRVELSGAELGDADLKALVRHLDGFMQRYVDKIQGGHYVLNIDLSCNSYITDNGVATHLVSFLNKWPICHRLKLYKNAIGDQTLKALSSWVADGYVHELHLSDLFGKVTGDAVLHLLKEIHRKGNYPYLNGGRAKCPLWLRLEHNGISDADGLITRAKAQGMSLAVLDRADLARVRPGSSNVKGGQKDNIAVNLVLFRLQDRTAARRTGGRGPGPEPALALGEDFDERPMASSTGGPLAIGAVGTSGLAPVGSGAAGIGLVRPSSTKATARPSGPTSEYYHLDAADSKRFWEAPDAEIWEQFPDEDTLSEGPKPGMVPEPRKLWEQPKEGPRPRGSKALSVADLQMGCASYRPSGTRSGPAGAPAYPPLGSSSAKGKAHTKQIDIASSTAFPSLGGPADKAESLAGGSWGAPNIHAAVAWGAAPTAVFDGKARATPKVKPPQPPSAGRESSSHDLGTKQEVEEPGPTETEEAPNQVEAEEDAVRKPLSFAEKNILKARKKLREVEKIEEAIRMGHKIENSQLAKVQKKTALEQELRTLESRSLAQGGRSLQELEKAERWRKEHEEHERAAIGIQKVVRGFLVRNSLMELEEKESEPETHSAEGADHGTVGRMAAQVEDQHGDVFGEDAQRDEELRREEQRKEELRREMQQRMEEQRREELRREELRREELRREEQRREEHRREELLRAEQYEAELRRQEQRMEELRMEELRREELRKEELRKEELRREELLRAEQRLKEQREAETKILAEQLMEKQRLKEQQEAEDKLVACMPLENWFYRTPSGEVQGPFPLSRMRAWHAYGYFRPDLPVRPDWYRNFYALNTLFPLQFQKAFEDPPVHPPLERRLLVAARLLSQPQDMQSPSVDVQMPFTGSLTRPAPQNLVSPNAESKLRVAAQKGFETPLQTPHHSMAQAQQPLELTSQHPQQKQMQHAATPQRVLQQALQQALQQGQMLVPQQMSQTAQHLAQQKASQSAFQQASLGNQQTLPQALQQLQLAQSMPQQSSQQAPLRTPLQGAQLAPKQVPAQQPQAAPKQPAVQVPQQLPQQAMLQASQPAMQHLQQAPPLAPQPVFQRAPQQGMLEPTEESPGGAPKQASAEMAELQSQLASLQASQQTQQAQLMLQQSIQKERAQALAPKLHHGPHAPPQPTEPLQQHSESPKTVQEKTRPTTKTEQDQAMQQHQEPDHQEPASPRHGTQQLAPTTLSHPPAQPPQPPPHLSSHSQQQPRQQPALQPPQQPPQAPPTQPPQQPPHQPAQPQVPQQPPPQHEFQHQPPQQQAPQQQSQQQEEDFSQQQQPAAPQQQPLQQPPQLPPQQQPPQPVQPHLPNQPPLAPPQQAPQQPPKQPPQRAPQQPPKPLQHQAPQQALPQAPQQAPPQAPQQAPPQAPQQAPPQAPQQAPPQAPQQAPPQAPQQAPPQAPQQAPPQAPQQAPPLAQPPSQQPPQQAPQRTSQQASQPLKQPPKQPPKQAPHQAPQQVPPQAPPQPPQSAPLPQQSAEAEQRRLLLKTPPQEPPRPAPDAAVREAPAEPQDDSRLQSGEPKVEEPRPQRSLPTMPQGPPPVAVAAAEQAPQHDGPSQPELPGEMPPSQVPLKTLQQPTPQLPPPPQQLPQEPPPPQPEQQQQAAQQQASEKASPHSSQLQDPQQHLQQEHSEQQQQRQQQQTEPSQLLPPHQPPPQKPPPQQPPPQQPPPQQPPPQKPPARSEALPEAAVPGDEPEEIDHQDAQEEEEPQDSASVDTSPQETAPNEPEVAPMGTTAPTTPSVHKEQSQPPQAPAPAKVDGQADAFAKFFKRVGKDALPSLEPDKALLTSPASAAVPGGPGNDASPEPPATPPTPPGEEELLVKESVEATKDKEKDKEKQKEPVWPRRAPDREPKKPTPEKPDEEAKPPAKTGFGLPPPGTVTKTKQAEEAGADSQAPEDDGDRVQEVSPLDHRFVGLVIGKAGETIKSFKKQSGASIEIDQNLPDGMPRVVIYRGSKKQVSAAKKLVDSLVQRAREDEKTKSSGAPIGAGMGIMGRGPGECKEREGPAVPEKGRPDETARPDLPPWRRARPGEEEPRGPTAEARGPRPTANRRDAPWAKREKECEAAPSGSLTGSLMSGDAKLSMRPAWMKPSKASGDTEDGGMLGVFDRSLWQEQKYSRSLFLQAKQKTLRMKAYEVPEEMMTMTTGPRPKWKPERREKEGVAEETNHKEDAAQIRKDGEPRAASPVPEDEIQPSTCSEPAAEKAVNPRDSEEAAAKRLAKQSGNGTSTGGGPYENLAGDSKDIMKLKKKLREIQKIEDSISAGENVEPNQKEKVTKKAAYLEELHLLESIVHSPAVGGNGNA